MNRAQHFNELHQSKSSNERDQLNGQHSTDLVIET